MQTQPTSFMPSLDRAVLDLNFEIAVGPLRKLQGSARENLNSYNPRPLDLKELKESRQFALKQLFPGESHLQADDFPESQRARYNFISKIRSF